MLIRDKNLRVVLKDSDSVEEVVASMKSYPNATVYKVEALSGENLDVELSAEIAERYFKEKKEEFRKQPNSVILVNTKRKEHVIGKNSKEVHEEYIKKYPREEIPFIFEIDEEGRRKITECLYAGK